MVFTIYYSAAYEIALVPINTDCVEQTYLIKRYERDFAAEPP